MDEFCVLYRCGDFVKIRHPGDSDETLWGTRKSGTPIRRQLSSPWLLPMAEAGDKILRIDRGRVRSKTSKFVWDSRQVPVALIQIIQDYACRTIEDCKEGDYVDAIDMNHDWYMGKIISLIQETAHIHFLGWSATNDESIPFPSERLAPPGYRTGIYSGVDILTS